MSELNRSGCSGSPPKHHGRTAVPPRNLPSQLDDSTSFTYDLRQVPFSPTSPGKLSPGRPKTMKECEEEISRLQSENFNLKIKIFFMDKNLTDQGIPKDLNALQSSYLDIKIKLEQLQKDLNSKEDLLLDSYRVVDLQKQQLEAIKSDHDAEKQELQNKIDALEKELKDYTVRFMETSVQLDDTNAMYALSFGLNGKPDVKMADNTDEKVKELERHLSKEKEQVLNLVEKITGLNAKSEQDQKCLQHLREQIEEMEKKLLRVIKERTIYERNMKDANRKSMILEKSLQEKAETIDGKEIEIQKMKYQLEEQEKTVAQTDTTLREFQKHLKSLRTENTKLKQEIKHLQQELENRSALRPLRERSSGRRGSEQDKEVAIQLRESQKRVEELQKDIENIKAKKTDHTTKFLIQGLVKDNITLKKEVEVLKYKLTGNRSDSSKEEVYRNIDELTINMSMEKDVLISELKSKIEELTEVIKENESTLQDYKIQLKSVRQDEENALSKTNSKEKDILSKELEDKNKEVEILKKELRKRTFNLQGLVNTELWDKNREIEKLNKVCERKHLEVLSLQKQVRELALVQERVTSFVSPIALQTGLYTENKENLQPGTDPTVEIHHLTEDKRLLERKVEELQARLLNTPERDTESLLVQNLRAEKDQVEKMRKEAVNACMLLTTRLQELADFLDSLLPSLCGKKRKVVQQAVERSRELSRSLSLAAEDSSILQCSAWTDLQPSLYVPLLPDISTVDFWSGDEEEAFIGGEEVARLKSKVETLREEVKQKDGEIARFKSEKNYNDSLLIKSMLVFDETNFLDNAEKNELLDENLFCNNIEDITEGLLVDTGSEQNSDKSQFNKLLPEVKSANIGKITLTSRKKDTSSHSFFAVEEANKLTGKGGCPSEYETWSEPDRDVSYARMGLKEVSTNTSKSLQLNFGDTSETGDSMSKSPSSKRFSEIQRLQRKIHSLEQVNEALRSELLILHQLAPPASNRQDKATSIELSRQSSSCIPSHLLEEIRNQREKLEASLFHNDYIRRQLECTVSSLRKCPGDDQEKAFLIQLKDITNQLEISEHERIQLKLEKEQWSRKQESMQSSIQHSSKELMEKQCALLELQNKTSQTLMEMEENCNKKCLQAEQKFEQLELKWLDLQKEKNDLMEKINESNQQVAKLSADIENYDREGKKNKQLQEDLNLQLQLICRQKDDLQRVVGEQEQLLTDAERERQELATQLIARDRQVSDLQKRLSHMELTSNELEAALRSQLDIATHQCAQFEAKIRDLDNSNKQIAHVERIKCELERRVAELEAVNVKLETRLASLNVVKPLYSDCETETGSSLVGSPQRHFPPPLILPTSPQRPTPSYTTQRSHDHTSDYLSDQDAVLCSPQTLTHNLWSPTSPHSHTSASPDLGIESDHGRFSSLETHVSRPTDLPLRGTPVKDFLKLEEENTQLRHNLQKTRHALEETLAQLTAANQHKRQYEAQLSAANQHKAKVERAICRQIHKTHSILKKARVNLEEDGKSETH